MRRSREGAAHRHTGHFLQDGVRAGVHKNLLTAQELSALRAHSTAPPRKDPAADLLRQPPNTKRRPLWRRHRRGVETMFRRAA